MQAKFVATKPFALAVGLSFLLHLVFPVLLPKNNIAVWVIAALQIGLMGVLLSRALNLLSSPHPIVRLATLLIAGLIALIVIGAPFRFLHLPIPLYVITLHVVMLILSFFAARKVVSIDWKLTPERAALWGTVGVCIAVIVGFAAHTTQYRYTNEFGDRGLFAFVTEWLVTGKSDEGLFNRLIGQSSDFRMQIDGWTYASASWVQVSHGEAYEYLWHQQTLMFVWMIPVLFFALTYQLTKNELAATLAVVVLMFFAIHTVDTIGFQSVIRSERHPLFDLRTLREIGLGLLLIMSLFAGALQLREGNRGWFFLLGLCGVALASVHPRAFLVFMLFGVAIGFLLVLQRKIRLNPVVILVALLVSGLLGVSGVVLLRSRLPQFMSAASGQAICTADNLPINTGEFGLSLSLPLIGQTYILSITQIFLHFLFALGLVSSVYLALRNRREKTLLFYVAPLLIVGLLVISPIIIRFGALLLNVNVLIGDACELQSPFVTNVLDNLISTAQLSLLSPVFIGAAIADLLSRYRLSKRAAPFLTASVTPLFLIITLFEPIPIQYSARDQLRTMDDAVVSHLVFNVDKRFATVIAENIDLTLVHRFLAPTSLAGTLIEQVPNTLVATPTGGAYQAQTERFFNVGAQIAPLLDANDILFLQEANIEYILIRIFDTRYPQLLLDTDRFERIAQVDGNALFRIKQLAVTPEDTLFGEMNAIFPQPIAQNWQQSGLSTASFDALFDADTAQRMLPRWQALPSTSLRAYGMALLSLFSRSSSAEIDEWTSLTNAHPILVEDLALSLVRSQQEGNGVRLLLDALGSETPEVQLTAARALLTERYFYILSPDDVHTILAAIAQRQEAWRTLTREDAGGALQARIELLMSAGVWQTAAEWSEWITPFELRSDELAMRGLALLAQGDVSRALETLEVSTDSGWLMPRVRMHADRWENNTAAQTYAMLAGNLAERNGLLEEAANYYRDAIGYGAMWAGRAFLADVTGDSALRASLESEWVAQYETPFPILSPLLKIADIGRVYVSDPSIKRSSSETTIEVSALYGSAFERHYPINDWRVAIGDPSLSVLYDQLEADAHLIPGALVRTTFSLLVPSDIPELSPAQLLIRARHNNAVTMGNVSLSLVLNRPASAAIPSDATILNARFGDTIALTHYRIDHQEATAAITLYWQTDQPVSKDYQVSVQARDASGEILFQQDNSPVNGRYPTSQWQANTPIEDTYILTLPEGTHDIAVLVYSLEDSLRLLVQMPDQVGISDDVLLNILNH